MQNNKKRREAAKDKVEKGYTAAEYKGSRKDTPVCPSDADLRTTGITGYNMQKSNSKESKGLSTPCARPAIA
jgi:hypothetical protein